MLHGCGKAAVREPRDTAMALYRAPDSADGGNRVSLCRLYRRGEAL